MDCSKKISTKHKERLTKPREEVFKIIAASSKPLGAYEILKKLGEVMESPKPPTVYRAIDFWLQKGAIHRIESLNAYFICTEGHKHQGSQFMICNNCNSVIEINICELPKQLKQLVKQNVFSLSNWNIEIHGLCSNCQSTENHTKQ